MARGRLTATCQPLPSCAPHSISLATSTPHQAAVTSPPDGYDSRSYHPHHTRKKASRLPADPASFVLSRHGRNDDNPSIALAHFDAHAFGPRGGNTGPRWPPDVPPKLHHQNRQYVPVCKTPARCTAQRRPSKPQAAGMHSITTRGRLCSAGPKGGAFWPGTSQAASAGYPLRSKATASSRRAFAIESTGQVHRQGCWRGRSLNELLPTFRRRFDLLAAGLSTPFQLALRLKRTGNRRVRFVSS